MPKNPSKKPRRKTPAKLKAVAIGFATKVLGAWEVEF
jgi:hypothetical protein